MTHYVGGGLRPQNGPWVCAGCDAYFFLADADQTAMQKQIDESLNEHVGWQRFKVLVDAVAITFQTLKDLQSKIPVNTQPLSLNYEEAALWLLVQDLKDNSIKVWVPYMFCSDPVALYTGRQIYGFPKEFGIIRSPDSTGRFSVTAHAASLATGMGRPAIKQVLSGEQIFSAYETADAARPKLSGDVLATLRQQQLLEMPVGLWQIWGGFDSPWSQYLKLLLSPSINFVFSKNDFDITNQQWKTSITMADSPVTQLSFKSIMLPHNFSLTLDNTHNFAKEFGLVGTVGATTFELTTLLGAAIELKFELSIPRHG